LSMATICAEGKEGGLAYQPEEKKKRGKKRVDVLLPSDGLKLPIAPKWLEGEKENPSSKPKRRKGSRPGREKRKEAGRGHLSRSRREDKKKKKESAWQHSRHDREKEKQSEKLYL